MNSLLNVTTQPYSNIRLAILIARLLKVLAKNLIEQVCCQCVVCNKEHSAMREGFEWMQLYE